jgi:hypothetical protein
MAPYSRTSSDTPIILDASHSQLELLPGSPEPTAEGIREQGHPPSYPGEGGPPRQLPWSGSSASSLKGAALVSRVESDSSLGSSGTENSRNSQRIQPVAYNCTEICGDTASEVTPDNRQSELEATESERFKLAEVGAPSTCRAHERGGGSRAGATQPGVPCYFIHVSSSLIQYIQLHVLVLLDTRMKYPTPTVRVLSPCPHPTCLAITCVAVRSWFIIFSWTTLTAVAAHE